ncbi:AzlC family ABC transporter permease [Bacillus sp. B1-b2]|uniref:AzlC family ABC transporter permease n=1 Tax=Bacillus sp. B1-b2 TaxID=2653201 RepID=UPI0012619BBF|nr:AzlC family ABC transporter permease [Bacillus sp. B1-b2]
MNNENISIKVNLKLDVSNSKVQQAVNIYSFKDGIKDCVPTLLGYISIGIAMGVVGISSGLSVVHIFLLSTFVYAGASQFIICAMIASASPISAIIMTTFIVNLRHLLLSSALAPTFTKYSIWKNIGIGSLVTDESFGVAITKIARKAPITDAWMNGLNLTAYIVWILSCTLGGIIGGWFPDPATFGLDYALTAMFIALLILQLQTIEPSKLRHYLFLIVLMILFMSIFSTFLSSSLSVILSTVIVATIGVVTDK